MKIFPLQVTTLLVFLPLQATAMDLAPCAVLQANILHHHVPEAPGRPLVQLLLGLLRPLLVDLVLEVPLVIGIEIIGWGGISHLLPLCSIDQGLLVRWEGIHMVEVVAVAGMDVETHATEVDIDPEKKIVCSFQFSFVLRSAGSFLL